MHGKIIITNRNFNFMNLQRKVSLETAPPRLAWRRGLRKVAIRQNSRTAKTRKSNVNAVHLFKYALCITSLVELVRERGLTL